MSLSSYAELGKDSYQQMCSACHGKDGEGMSTDANNAGAGIPPLMKSEWLSGDADRIAQILLKGLEGPITVKGKHYNQIMPAQGALSDEQLVAVINYVRAEFSDEKGSYSISDLDRAKLASKDRKKGWKADELLKKYPLPRPESPLKHLLMHTYDSDGQWEGMPDFTKLESTAVEEEHDGYVSLRKINKKVNYGVVWVGELEIRKDAEYEFQLDSDDGSRLSIDGKQVCEVRGLGAMGRSKTGKVVLSPGLHKFRLEFYQEGGGSGISLKFKKKKSKWVWLSDEVKSKKTYTPVIDLTPKDGRVRMYNNFIVGASHRTMGVAYPGGYNIAFSTQHCSPELIWKGDFIDAGRHWTNRGQGAQPPSSKKVTKLVKGAAWSETLDFQPLPVQLKGYTMNGVGNPTFAYEVGEGISVTEKYINSDKDFSRLIRLKSDKSRQLVMKISESGVLDGNSIKVNGLKIESVPSAKFIQKGNAFYLYLTLKEIKENQIQIKYSWPN